MPVDGLATQIVTTACSSSPDVAMEDARSPLLVGAAAARDAAERRSASLPVSELSPPPGELSEDSFICHICLVSAYSPGRTHESLRVHANRCIMCEVCML